MPRIAFCIVLVYLSVGCANKNSNLGEEREIFVQTARVAHELSLMGFAVDLSNISIIVKNAADMASMFNALTNESNRDLKPHYLSGPKSNSSLKFADGAKGRLAFYEPNSKTIVFLEGARELLSDGYLAHELAHVYQDQRWGFAKIWDPYRQNPSKELFNITQFIIEGHAELVREAYEQWHAKDSMESLKKSANLGKISENDCLICDFPKSSANLPYSLGMRFLLNNFRIGGWSLVEAFFEKLPTSTEQIIHPNKHKKDEPTQLDLPLWTDDLESPKLTLSTSLGEAFLLAKLINLFVPNAKALEAASGWDGDIAQLYQTKDGDEVLLWRILFDRNIDAQQLENALRRQGKRGEISRIGRVVDWIISDNRNLTRKLRNFLSKHALFMEPDALDAKSTVKQELQINNDKKQLPGPYATKKILLGPKLAD